MSMSRAAMAYALLGSVGVLGMIGRADAQSCSQTPGGKDCWNSYSGPTFGMVAVGPRLMCAAYVSNAIKFYDGFECFSSGGSFGGPYPPNMGSVIGNTTATRIKSLAVQQLGSSVGPTGIWVMRGDGTLWQSTCDIRFRDSRDYATNLVQVASPVDDNGFALTFKQITAVRGYFNGSSTLSTTIVGMTSGSRYVQNGNHWSRDPNDLYQHPGMLIYGSDMAGALEQTSSIALQFRWRDPALAPLPSIPAGTTLAGAPSFKDGFGASTQPFASGFYDAWIVTNSTQSSDLFIMRSKLVNGAWTPWAYYPTAPFPDNNNPPLFPWSIADANFLAYPAHRGDLVGIGSNYHLVHYIAP